MKPPFKVIPPEVAAGLDRANVRIFYYDPATELLFPITGWGRMLQSVLAGDPKPPFPLAHHWYQCLDRLPLRDGVVFDVGVNYGYTSAWFAKRAASVFAFEPNPKNQVYIAEHLRLRGLDNVELIPVAVSEHSGRAVLHIKGSDGQHSLADIGASQTLRTMDVEVTSIDDFATARGIDRLALLKVGVEGFEADVFRGTAGLLSRKAIASILFEFSPTFYKQRGIDPLAPARLLEQYGYRLETVHGRRIFAEQLPTDGQAELVAFPA